MPVDVSRFVGEPNKFEGIYQAADTVQKQRYRDQQLEQERYDRQQAQQAKNAATSKFLENYYDPKEHLTGTVYDPQITKDILGLQQEAQQMIASGVNDPNMITMALAPKANRLFQYSQTAKYINDNLNKQLQEIPANSGYLKDKLRQKALEAAFMDEKGNRKDISTIDPDADYIAEAVKKYPGQVTDNTGLTEYIQKVPKAGMVVDAKTYNSKGGFTRKKLKVTAPEFMQLDVDDRGNNTRELVPKFELATDDENPITHTFTDKSGKQVEAPVRLVDENVYRSILKSNPSYADNLRGQVMDVIKQYKNEDGSPIDINSPQATNVARALLYDDLKSLKPGTVEDIVESKPTQIHVYDGSGSSSKGPTTIRDVYGDIDNQITKSKESGQAYLQVNLLPGDTQTVVLDEARKATGDNQLGYGDIKLIKDDNNKIGIYDATSNQLIKYLTPVGTNVKAQPSVKEKREVIKQGNNGSASTMVTMVLPDGRKGQIPESAVGQFLKDNPKAKRQ